MLDQLIPADSVEEFRSEFVSVQGNSSNDISSNLTRIRGERDSGYLRSNRGEEILQRCGTNVMVLSGPMGYAKAVDAMKDVVEKIDEEAEEG